MNGTENPKDLDLANINLNKTKEQEIDSVLQNSFENSPKQDQLQQQYPQRVKQVIEDHMKSPNSEDKNYDLDTSSGSPANLRIIQGLDLLKIENQSNNHSENGEQLYQSEQNQNNDDEIKEDMVPPKSPIYQSQDNQQQQNFNNFETFDSLSKHAQEPTSINHLIPQQEDHIIYQRSCEQFDKFEKNQKRKKGQGLQLNLQSNFDQVVNDRPSQIEKRQSMMPIKVTAGKKYEDIPSSIRRKSLPEFNELDKEPDYDLEDIQNIYKIYCGDAIDEGGQDDMFVGDSIDNIEDKISETSSSNRQQARKSSINPMEFLKNKPHFNKDDYEDEEAAETPIDKCSKFEEDRAIVEHDKMENGGITPQKYIHKQQFSFKVAKNSNHIHHQFDDDFY